MKAWGRNNPDASEEPHTCTIGRKFWLSDNGGCTLIGISSREKKKVEEHLRSCGALHPDEAISGAMEAVLFDDTLGELCGVVDEGLSED